MHVQKKSPFFVCEAEKAIISESPLKYVKPFTYGNELNLGPGTIPESVRADDS